MEWWQNIGLLLLGGALMHILTRLLNMTGIGIFANRDSKIEAQIRDGDSKLHRRIDTEYKQLNERIDEMEKVTANQYYALSERFVRLETLQQNYAGSITELKTGFHELKGSIDATNKHIGETLARLAARGEK